MNMSDEIEAEELSETQFLPLGFPLVFTEA